MKVLKYFIDLKKELNTNEQNQCTGKGEKISILYN